MLRRLHHDQPDSFAFTPANQAWAEAQLSKYPQGRQASAIIPLLWRAQEQEGWLSRPAIEYVADMLGMAHIRALEVATFYFMFQLQPVGSVAHVQICGTTTCMICGSGELMAVCKERIAPRPHQLSADGRFSWEEVECLGACSNAPMAQIGKDYYEDLTGERLAAILDELAAGRVPVPGPQNGRYAAEPLAGLTCLTEHESGRTRYNATVQMAVDRGDTVARIDGTEGTGPRAGRPGAAASRPEPAVTPGKPAPGPVEAALVRPSTPLAGEAELAARKGSWRYQAASAPAPAPAPAGPMTERAPETLTGPRGGKADDLKLLKGVGPKLERMLNDLGFYHFDQIAAWTEAEIAWVDARLSFKGRIERDDWVAQARQLAAGEETEFARRAKADGIYD